MERLRSQACVLLKYIASHIEFSMTLLLKKKNRSNNNNIDNDNDVLLHQTLLEHLQEILLPRLTDKSQVVRQNAIQAIGKLLVSMNPSSSTSSKSNKQNTDNDSDEEEDEEEDETTSSRALEGLLWSMWHDPSVANRVEAVQAVPITTDTIDHIIARIRDVKEKVRVAALDVLRTMKTDPRKVMNEDHYCEIIQRGLTERCEATKTATIKLICTKWMKVAKFDPVELLRLMGATVNDEECEKTLKVILQTVRSGDFTAMDELSDPEVRSLCANIDNSMIQLKDDTVVFDEYQLFYTRVACSTAKESTDLTYVQKEDLISKITPDIPALCGLFQKHMQRFIESIEEEDQESEDQECFVCLQLLQLAKVAGLQEEGSRRHFANVMVKTLASPDTPEDLVEECVESLRVANDDNEFEFFNAISVVLTGLMSSEGEDDFVMDESKETERNSRILFIFSVVLENAVSSLSSHDLFDNMVKIILSAVTSSNRSIREVGISCFGKLGLFSDESTVLNEFKPILLKIVANDREALQCRGQALLALADWALLYKDVLTPYQDNDGQSLTLLEFVHDMMQHANKSIASIAAEVAAKLLFSGRVSDHDLVGRLLACFLDPNRQKDTEDEDTDDASTEVGSPLRLQQLLSLFFPAFCLKSDESRRFLLGSIGSAMKVAGSLPKTKKRPLVFPLVKLAEYVCSIIAQSHLAAKENTENDKELNTDEVFFAGSLQVARFLVKHEGDLSVTQRRSLCKFLGGQNFEASSIDKASLRKLKGYVNDLSFMSDSSSVKSLGPLVEVLRDVEGGVDDDDDGIEAEPAEATGDASSDEETVTEHSSGNEEDDDAESAGESTVDDVLMDSLATLTMKSKENPTGLSSAKASHKSRRSSSQSTVSILESLGSPNHV